MTIQWPASLVPAKCNPTLRNFTTSGGRSMTGREQRVYSDAGYWSIDMQRIVVKGRAERYAYTAMINRLRQGEDVIVPIFDLYAAVGAANNGSTAAVAAAALLRATSLSITVSGLDVQAGVRFSIADRLYEISEVVSGPASPPLENQLTSDSPWADDQPWTDTVNATGTYVVKILPPLRAPVAVGNQINFSAPELRCIPADPGDGDLDLEIGRYGFPSITFIEVI